MYCLCSTDESYRGQTEAKLVGVDLSGADLSDAKLSQTEITQTDLCGTKLLTNLHNADLSGSIYDKTTQWPEGFNPETVGSLKLTP